MVPAGTSLLLPTKKKKKKKNVRLVQQCVQQCVYAYLVVYSPGLQLLQQQSVEALQSVCIPVVYRRLRRTA